MKVQYDSAKRVPIADDKYAWDLGPCCGYQRVPYQITVFSAFFSYSINDSADHISIRSPAVNVL
jgi:hypothetical protein